MSETRSETSERATLAIDAMGGDAGPEPVVAGAARALKDGTACQILLFGDEALLTPLVAEHAVLSDVKIIHCESVVSMTDKPAQVLRRGRNTSMWAAISAVKEGSAQVVVSGGNTGALMAMSKLQLRMIKGIDRPAITAFWPTPRGKSVVLDVGANVEANANQLVQFAIMGDAFFRAMSGKEKPTIGLLNVGAEELKGNDLIRNAAKILREADNELAFAGFVEGNDISNGTVDVVVTDGFSGNIALKSAEGAARLVGKWMKEALKGSLLSRLGTLLMIKELRKLKGRIDPSTANGGVLLGLNGTVLKSHGGADAKGVASAITMAANLAAYPFQAEISDNLSRIQARTNRADHASSPTNSSQEAQNKNIKAVV